MFVLYLKRLSIYFLGAFLDENLEIGFMEAKEIEGLVVGVNCLVQKGWAVHMKTTLVELAEKTGYHISNYEVDGKIYIIVYRAPFKTKIVSEGYSELWSGNALYHCVGHKLDGNGGWAKA